MPYEIWTLTEEQKAIVLANYEKLAIAQIVPMVFPEAKPDSRTTEGRSIKAFLAGEGKKTLSVETAAIKKGEYILSEEQKRLIEEMAPRMKKDGGSLELARMVCNDQTLTSLHMPARAVYAYMKEVYPEGINMAEEPVEDVQWQPPVTMSHLVGLVNTFVQQSDNSKTYNLNLIKPQERKCLEQMMIYMRVYAFKYVASTFDKRVDRDLFLSTFIRWTHTKPDLTEIEVDQMINAAAETVNIAQMGREIEEVRNYHELIRRGEITNELGKVVRYGMAQVEEINGLRTKWDQSKGRLKELMKTLETARSERLKGIQQKYASVWDLLEPWMKDEKTRNILIEAGIQEKEDDAKEVERLSGLEVLIALVSGQTKEEGRR